MTKTYLTFNDILIQPKFSHINSRKDVDLSVQLGPMNLSLPVLSANMDTITESTMAISMYKYGGLGVLHRFQSVQDNLLMYGSVLDGGADCAVAVGLGDIELERAEALYALGARIFVLDVASAANINVVGQYISLKTSLPNSFIIVGNFATYESILQFRWSLFYYTSNLKIDAVKIGIGPSGVCTTRVKTGVGIPQFSALEDVYPKLKAWPNPPMVVADGGLKSSGDVAKALMFSDVVMCGGMLSGTDETPGELEDINKLLGKYPQICLENATIDMITKLRKENRLGKIYRGSASLESYEVQNKVAKHRTAEGVSTVVASKGPVDNVLQDIEGGLRSSLSYTDSKNLFEFKINAEYIVISNSSYIEGTSYGKKD